MNDCEDEGNIDIESSPDIHCDLSEEFLNSPISDDEIKQAVKKLAYDKAAGHDLIIDVNLYTHDLILLLSDL
jgi:hypothetical protein